MPQIITLLTLTLVRSTWYEESTPLGGFFDVFIDVDYQVVPVFIQKLLGSRVVSR